MTQPMTLSLFSPAKINLFLHITGKRDDGYHNLQTAFRLLSWGDALSFEVSERSFSLSGITVNQSVGRFDPHTHAVMPVELDCNVPLTAHLADNLIVKAAYALIAWLNLHRYALLAKQSDKHSSYNPSLNTSLQSGRLPIIRIKLDKVLPAGAGLGGGSSNAATTLLALNQLWGLHLDTQTLIEIGATIGADVPIFLFGQDAIAEGIGEQLTSIELPDQHYLLLNPSAHASTQALFAHPDLQRHSERLTHEYITQHQKDFISSLKPPFYNAFEPIVSQLVPEVKQALDYLRSLEAITHTTARMTGTGSSVFLPIPKSALDEIDHHITQTSPPPCAAILTESLTQRKT